MLAMREKKKPVTDIEQVLRDAEERRILHKLEVRARLMRMADEARAIQLPPAEREVQRLREYLQDWRARLEAYRPKLGAPSQCSWVSKQSPEVHSAAEYLERSDAWAMEVIERSLEDLRKRDDGHAMRAALMTRLMNLALPARVIRHGRLLGISTAEVDALADQAERALVEIVKVYGLPL